MNFGWRLAGWGYGFDTALHEIGHTLGLPHEHQNPHAGIMWDETAVYRYFRGPPNNWDRQRAFYNILRKLSPNLVRGSDWDRDSIMHYGFPAGLITDPEEFRSAPLEPAPNLSEGDIEWIRRFYPPRGPSLPELRPFESQRLRLSPGQQVDFEVRPDATREYAFQTFGRADSVLALFEEVEADDGGLRFRAGDDDSGTGLNAAFEAKLFKGRRYVFAAALVLVVGIWRNGRHDDLTTKSRVPGTAVASAYWIIGRSRRIPSSASSRPRLCSGSGRRQGTAASTSRSTRRSDRSRASRDDSETLRKWIRRVEVDGGQRPG